MSAELENLDAGSARRVLVVGCGYVGAPLASRLAAAGDAVWGMTRTRRPAPPGVTLCCADVTRPASLVVLPRDLDAVVVLLATGGGGDADYRGLYVDGMSHLLTALEQGSPALGRLVFVSSTGVYGDQGGGWVDEDSELDPKIEAGRALVEAEALVRAGPFRSVVVRYSGIYGPTRTRLVRTVASGRATFEPGPPRYLNQIHRDDCIDAVRHVLELPDPAAVYLATDHEPAPRREILAWIARRLGVPGPAEAPDAVAVPGGLRGNKRCRNDRLVGSGYRFTYPTYREGYAAVLDEAAGLG